jgi:hypothetical protein
MARIQTPKVAGRVVEAVVVYELVGMGSTQTTSVSSPFDLVGTGYG